MASRPKGIYVIAQSTHTWDFGNGQTTDLACWYVPFEGAETIEQATQRAVMKLPLRTKVAVVSDSTAATYDIAPSLQQTS